MTQEYIETLKGKVVVWDKKLIKLAKKVGKYIVKNEKRNKFISELLKEN